MQKIEIQLEALTCPTCSKKIENALSNAAGVLSVSVFFATAKAKLEIDESVTNTDNLKRIITRLGYTVISIKTK